MQEKKQQQSSHADHVARRAFIKKAAIGAAFAIPAMETFTKSDILVKSALAASGPVFTITAEVFQGTGNISPNTQKVAAGGSAIVTLSPGMAFTWTAYSFDHGMTWTNTTGAEQTDLTYTFNNVQADIFFVVRFDNMV
jgi:hypothetical protein